MRGALPAVSGRPWLRCATGTLGGPEAFASASKSTRHPRRLPGLQRIRASVRGARNSLCPPARVVPRRRPHLSHPRGVFRPRVSLDRKYPQIVEECVAAMQATMPDNKIHVLLTPSNCCSVSAYSRSWPRLSSPTWARGQAPRGRSSFPGGSRSWRNAGRISCSRGLIQSDGCRSINTGRGGFCSACDAGRVRRPEALSAQAACFAGTRLLARAAVSAISSTKVGHSSRGRSWPIPSIMRRRARGIARAVA